jgi:hypothetical protein
MKTVALIAGVVSLLLGGLWLLQGADSGEDGHCLRSEGGHDYGGKADSFTVMADTPLPSSVVGVSGGVLFVKP